MKKVVKKILEYKFNLLGFAFTWEILYAMLKAGMKLSDWNYWIIFCCVIAIFVCGRYSAKK